MENNVLHGITSEQAGWKIFLVPVHVVFVYCMNKIFISGNSKKINQQYTL